MLCLVQETVVQQGHDIERLERMHKERQGAPICTAGASEVVEALAAERKQQESLEAAKVQLQVRHAADAVPSRQRSALQQRCYFATVCQANNVAGPNHVLIPAKLVSSKSLTVPGQNVLRGCQHWRRYGQVEPRRIFQWRK